MNHPSPPHRSRSSYRCSLVVKAAMSALFLPAAALAQSGSQAADTGASQRSATQQSTNANSKANANAGARSLNEQDRELIQDLAHANLAEIETGRLALEKTQNPQVRQFAQKMIDDHTKAQQQLAQLAQRKGAQVPQETDFQHKAIATGLRVLDGNTFDERYLQHVGVNDHRRTVDLLEKTQRTARDPDLKSLASKTLPIVQNHLAMARQMSGQNEASGNSNNSRTMGAAGQQPSR